eukprot:767548-Hanusia_phi.AAC.3
MEGWIKKPEEGVTGIEIPSVRNLIVTVCPSIAVKMPSKSARWCLQKHQNDEETSEESPEMEGASSRQLFACQHLEPVIGSKEHVFCAHKTNAFSSVPTNTLTPRRSRAYKIYLLASAASSGVSAFVKTYPDIT